MVNLNFMLIDQFFYFKSQRNVTPIFGSAAKSCFWSLTFLPQLYRMKNDNPYLKLAHYILLPD